MLGISIFAFYPFANGFGCSFNSISDDSEVEYFTTCSNGLVTSIIKNKITGEKFKYTGIIGRKNDIFLLILLRASTIKKADKVSSPMKLELNRAGIYTAKQIRTEQGDYILLQKPVHRIYKTRVVGKLSFFD